MNPTDPMPQNNEGRKRQLTTFIGILCGDLFIGLVYFLGVQLLTKVNGLSFLGVPSFFLVPLLGGVIACYCWRKLHPTIVFVLFQSLVMTGVLLVAGALILHEGAICLLIVSPLLYASILAGAFLGRMLFRSDSSRMYVSVLPLAVLAVLAEPLARTPQERSISDEILIHAPPSVVWPQVTTFPEIPESPSFWLFRLGLPYPQKTTATEQHLGAARECIFSHQAIFKEQVSEWEPREKLTFEILESPPDPELVGHLTPHRGQFVLRPNPDGTTTLIGTTWYTLHVRPLWYFDRWTRHIFGAVHLRVMKDIRRRAEAASQKQTGLSSSASSSAAAGSKPNFR